MNLETRLSHDLQCLILEPSTKATRSIIWLHGLGADGHDFAPIVPELGVQDNYNIRFVFPHAPSMPVSLNNGYIMPAWFDIYGLDKNSREDAAGINAASNLIFDLIENEHKKGIDYDQIILVGFSQGAAMALYSGLKFNKKLAGIVGLSGYLPRFDEDYPKINQDTPILLAHGSQDPVVLKIFGESARDRLLAKGYHVTWNEYPMQHQVCQQEITDIAGFIREIY